MRFELDAIVGRGPVPESRHALEFALCDAGGRLVAGTAQPERVTMFRSAAKPFQILPLVERGHIDAWGFGDEELAVMTASHTGSAHHLALVRGVLERAGFGPGDLACGFHEPDDPGSLAALRSGAEPRSPLYNNCSGQHAGLLALCRSEGWPAAGYCEPAHPLQQLLLRTVAEVCGVDPGSVPTAVDGCGLVVSALPLRAMARGYAALAAAAARPGGDARARALARVAGAMAAHPRTVEGAGRTSTTLMQATGGRLLAKCGAEGLQLVGLTDRGQGLAIKCVDGAQRAVPPAVVAALAELGALSADELAALAGERRTVLRNAAGLEVGHITAELRVTDLN